MKVKELLKDCQKLVKMGMGDREVYLSNDDEGNGYHETFYSFTTDEKEIAEADWHGDIADPGNAVILG